MSDQDHSGSFSNDNFWAKVGGYAKVAGQAVLTPAFQLYYAWDKPDCPAWAKAVIIGALGYFISPIDVIPDFTPVIGYSDDLGVLVAAVSSVASQIDDDVRAKAQSALTHWFG